MKIKKMKLVKFNDLRTLLLIFSLFWIVTACGGRVGRESSTLEIIETNEDPPKPFAVKNYLSLGFQSSCGLEDNGTLKCWGRNTQQQREVTSDIGPVRAIAMGYHHGCGIKADSTVKCWGRKNRGQTNVPADLGTVTEIAAGIEETCAIKSNGVLQCWGLNTNTGGQTLVPDHLGPVTAVAIGQGYICAIKSDGTLFCWGDNSRRQTSIPVDLGRVSAVAAGSNYVCAIRADGLLSCWGDNTYGSTDVPVDLGPVTRVAVGRGHTCAIKIDGSLRCWGRNTAGVINSYQRDVPEYLGAVTDVAAGAYHVCVRKVDGTLRCWGANDSGQTNVPMSFFSRRPNVSEADALFYGFYERRQSGNYANSYGPWLSSVTLNGRAVSVASSAVPQQERAYVIRNRNQGVGLIQRINQEALALGIPVTRRNQDISIAEHHFQLLSQNLQEDLDPAFGIAVGSVEVDPHGGVHADWEERAIPQSVRVEINRIRQRIDDRIQQLNQTTVGGYYVNPRHFQAGQALGSDIIQVHTNIADGQAMTRILEAIQIKDEELFVRSVIDFATGYPIGSAIAKRAFIDAFSSLFVTDSFPSLGSRQAFYHFIFRCGQLY